MFAFCASRIARARSGKENRMLKSAIMLLAVFTFCAVALVGCRAEGEVGKTASQISVAR
jgi:hypothetical protein